MKVGGSFQLFKERRLLFSRAGERKAKDNPETERPKNPGFGRTGETARSGRDEIIVDPRCKELINELRLYSYKVDKQTGDVLPVLMDAYNHYIDALRYAVAPLIRKLEPAKAAFGVYGNR